MMLEIMVQQVLEEEVGEEEGEGEEVGEGEVDFRLLFSLSRLFFF